MKKYLFGAAAALAVVAPGMASAEMNGYAGAQYGWLSGDVSDSSDVDAASSWYGAFTSNLYGDWNFQFDGNVTDMDHNTHTHPFGAVQGHAFVRNDSHAIGVFVSQLNIDGSNFYGLGVEGAMYFQNFTWGGQVGWATPTYDNPDEVWNIGTQGTFFITDRFTVGGEISYTDSEYYNGEILSFGLGGEYQFQDSPFSIGLNWTHGEADYNPTFESDVIAISGRLNFGTADLRERDRNGASFTGLTNVIRDHILGF